MSDDSDDDPATLRERVRELEQTVREQQATIEQLMPSRRAVLAGGAGLVGGAALTGQASAQTAAGQVGTSSEPVDVEAASVAATDVTADSVSTKQLDITDQLSAKQLDITDQLSATISLSDDGSNPTNWLSASNSSSTAKHKDTGVSVVADNNPVQIMRVMKAGMVVVVGKEEDSGVAFVDLILVVERSGVTKIATEDAFGPVATTYDTPNIRELTLSIDGSGETFNVASSFIGGF